LTEKEYGINDETADAGCGTVLYSLASTGVASLDRGAAVTVGLRNKMPQGQLGHYLNRCD
jgi:hypothetical protein